MHLIKIRSQFSNLIFNHGIKLLKWHEHKRLLSTTACCNKKHRNKKLSADLSSLKREAPFVFSSIKRYKGHPRIQSEEPLIFKPISSKIKEDDLIDDRAQLLHDLKVKPVHKKETVFIIQPNFKWGKDRFVTQLCDSRLAEAKALVEGIQSWDVYDTCIESVHHQNPKLFFGSGKVIELTKTIRAMINEHNVTMVFINTGKLSQKQIKEMEVAWGCKVFDRYRVVLELFKERASTKEAKLQVQLAEVYYLRLAFMCIVSCIYKQGDHSPGNLLNFLLLNKIFLIHITLQN